MHNSDVKHTVDLPLPRHHDPAERKTISIVMPAYNEEDILPQTYQEVTDVLESLPHDYEVILIDNDSTDRTPDLAAEFCQKNPHWRYVKFSRDFTAEISFAAGMRYARGDAVIFLASDLQEPPDEIPNLIAKWEEGYDVVYGVQTHRPGDPKWRNFLVSVFYRLMNQLSDIRLPVHGGDFRLLDRRVVNVLNQMDERTRYLRGLIHWVGFRRCPHYYSRRPRAAGESKAPLFSLMSLALNALTSFSIKPLRAFMAFGIAVLTATLVLGIFYVGAYFWSGTLAPGTTTTYLLLLTNLGVMSLGFGVVGEYVGKVVAETKRRPLWIVERTINLELDEVDSMGKLREVRLGECEFLGK